MKTFILITALTLPFLAIGEEEKAEKPELEFETIFNGEDFTGWTMKRDDRFFVEDGVIKATNDGGAGDILLTEKKDYENFVIELEFKLGEGNIDSGVFLRDTKEQIQIGVSGSLKKDMTAQAYIPGIGYPIQVDAEQHLKKDDWNTLRIKVFDYTYITWLNGEQIIEYDSDTMIEEPGTIGLQVHAKRDMTIYFRNIRVAET
ncbi:MAG: DUF1080 domain-containing protein [Verrucomicrobiota bacterium]